MHLDPIMPYLVGVILAILLFGLLPRRLNQPHPVGYLIAGVTPGPHGSALVQDNAALTRFGAIGVVMLLFYRHGSLSQKTCRQLESCSARHPGADPYQRRLCLTTGIIECLQWALNRQT